MSPSAYATGYFWYKHGLSHPALATEQGRRVDRIEQPAIAIKPPQRGRGMSI
jgi:hypothetical protein